ncbi:hypothetical protein ABGB17_37670 [Sphaerisporangium sp. B11E5]
MSVIVADALRDLEHVARDTRQPIVSTQNERAFGRLRTEDIADQ